MFRWPWGASRWAHGWFLASSNQVAEIQRKAFSEEGDEENPVPGQPIPVDLYIDAPGQRSQENLTTPVYVLSITPLARINVPSGSDAAFINGLYLITVVDERWFWWGLTSPTFTMTSSTTWATMIQALGDKVIDTELNTFGFDPVAVDYGAPSSSWGDLKYEQFPIVFDAVLANVGQRLVRAYNGDLYCEDTETADNDLVDDDEAHPDRTFRAGGVKFESKL